MSRRPCPVPEMERAGCPYAPNCYSDQHHLMWPSSDYRNRIEKQFRELPENKEQTCRWQHDQAHHEEPPDKPSRQEMLNAIAEQAIKGGHGTAA